MGFQSMRFFNSLVFASLIRLHALNPGTPPKSPNNGGLAIQFFPDLGAKDYLCKRFIKINVCSLINNNLILLKITYFPQ